MAKPRECTITINGDVWTAELLDRETYEKSAGKNSVATTNKGDRAFEFLSGDKFTLGTCVHEVWHAYHAYLYLNSVNNLTMHDHEEIIAEMLEDKLLSIHKTAEEIFTKLNGTGKK